MVETNKMTKILNTTTLTFLQETTFIFYTIAFGWINSVFLLSLPNYVVFFAFRCSNLHEHRGRYMRVVAYLLLYIHSYRLYSYRTLSECQIPGKEPLTVVDNVNGIVLECLHIVLCILRRSLPVFILPRNG